jgi:hypothetical protein
VDGTNPVAKGNLVGSTLNFYDTLKVMAEQDTQFQVWLAQTAASMKLVNETVAEATAASIDWDALTATYLGSKRSEQTKGIKQRALMKWTKWATPLDVDFLQPTMAQAQAYVAYLTETMAPNSVNVYVSTLSDLIEWARDTECASLHNYWRRTPKPIARNVNREDNPTDSDISTLIQYFQAPETVDTTDHVHNKAKAAPEIAAVVSLLAKYGWRSGALKDAKLLHHNRIQLLTKGKIVEQTITPEDKALILKYKLIGMDQYKVQTRVYKATKLLHSLGLISCPFSAHDIRHKFITEGAAKCQTQLEFVAFSRNVVCHASVNTTYNYVRA